MAFTVTAEGDDAQVYQSLSQRKNILYVDIEGEIPNFCHGISSKQETCFFPSWSTVPVVIFMC